jgi:hypothetical protein
MMRKRRLEVASHVNVVENGEVPLDERLVKECPRCCGVYLPQCPEGRPFGIASRIVVDRKQRLRVFSMARDRTHLLPCTTRAGYPLRPQYCGRRFGSLPDAGQHFLSGGHHA